MAQDQGQSAPPERADLQDMIAESDTGARAPGGISGKILWGVPLLWSLFQLWYASPLPFMLRFGVINDTQARSIHLAFAIFLAYTAYPTSKNSPRDYIPLQDWFFALLGAFCGGYLFLFYNQLATRPGLPTTLDVVTGVVGLAILLEATRRALGPPLMFVAIAFLIYAFAGQYMPDVVSHKDISLSRGMSHFWLSTEGVFGVPLGVSTSMVFLFVLFGSLLEKAGAGNWFIRVAFAFMGHMRGGPAKAAVVSSALTGLVSGSSIANVVTTGTFTIPLMRRVGFPAEKAGAVEVASSTNGQLTPPVMGAAAFLMVEYVGISYVEVIKHAFLPALISYIALVYIVHLESVKADIKGLPRTWTATLAERLLYYGSTILGVIVLSGIVYYGLGWIKGVAGAASPWIASAILVVAYVGLLRFSAKYPELDPNDPIDVLPLPGPTLKAGLYFLLPVVVLIWCLTVERLSPGLSAFWATVFMVFIMLTQRPLQRLFRGRPREGALREGAAELLDALVCGARNMIGIGVATAAAGIVVGTITLTGLGQMMTDFVEYISVGSLILMLLFTAGISLILGMGLPTTANYIVVSTLMAPVIVTLGAQNGLIIPLIAAHMFVFYFGILADDTPPVGLAAFAAAAISGGDPIRTGIQGFTYDIRTAILPFMFVFNTQLLMIGIDNWFHAVVVIAGAVLAMLVFAAATQGYFLVKSKIWESAALLLVTFTLFRPGFWMDMLYPPFEKISASRVFDYTESVPKGGFIRLNVSGETPQGKHVERTVMLQVDKGATGRQKLEDMGLELRNEGGRVFVDNVAFASEAKKQHIDFDWEIKSIMRRSDRPAKEWMFFPALFVLGGVMALQRRRRARTPSTP